MNAAIRALTRKAIHEGFEVFGIERGYLGIIEEKIFPLSNRDVGGIITQGGTMLKTARFPEFQNEEIQRKAYEILKLMILTIWLLSVVMAPCVVLQVYLNLVCLL